MSISYVKHIKPLEDAGENDTAIAQLISGVTAKDIEVADVRLLMRERQLWIKDSITRARDRGKIGVAMKDPSFPSELYDALCEFEAALYDMSAETVSCASRIDIAGQVYSVIGGLVAFGAITADDRTAFYDLGGGLIQDGATDADVANIRSAYQSQVANQSRQDGILSLQAEIENTWINPAISDGSTDAATLRATIKAGL